MDTGLGVLGMCKEKYPSPTTQHTREKHKASTMKLRYPCPGRRHWKSRGSSSTSSASSSPAAAAFVLANLNNALNNALTAATNDTGASPAPEPDSPVGQGHANNNTEGEYFEFDEHEQANKFLRLKGRNDR